MPPPFGPLRSVFLARGQAIGQVQATLAASGYRLMATHDLGDGAASARTVWADADGGEATLIPDLATGNLVLVLAPAAPLPTDLRLATAADARHLMEGQSPAEVLAGLQIAGGIGDPALVPVLSRHLQGTDRVVAAAAQQALTAIAAEVALALDPDPGAALLSVPGWRAEKLQLLRHLARGPAENAGPLLPLLARALKDQDWEIAVTAIVTAARLKLPELASDIAHARLPEGQRDGVTADEARFVLALRDAALAHLGHPRGRQLPPGMAAAVAGDGSGLPPRFALLFAALTLPLPPALPPPDLPGVTLGACGPSLADGTLLIWVPPVAHWLGDPTLSGPLASPPRRYVPDDGVFLSALPLPIGTLSRTEAQAELRRMADRTGVAVRLPRSDEWEMAARGADGRRYAWGCNAAATARVDLSPWGLAGACNGPGEWLNDAVDSGRSILAGGGALLNRSARAICDPRKTLRFRACLLVSC